MKIRKNGLMLSIIASLLFTALAISPSFATTATIAAPRIEDETLTYGESFYINITVADVTDMGGYKFHLYYDTEILRATGYSSYAPFTWKWHGEINLDEGYVAMAYTVQIAKPGLSTVAPVPIARIDFTVLGDGVSQLDLSKTEIGDVSGAKITHTVVDGSFSNIEGAPVALFYWTPETPIEGETVTFTSTSVDLDGEIVAWEWDFGDTVFGTGAEIAHAYGSAGTYEVALTVTDNEGKTDSFSDTLEVLPAPITMGVDLRNSKPAYRRFDVSVKEPETIITFTASVKNLNPEESTLVRVVWSIWEVPGMEPLGGIEALGRIDPKALATFTADFDVWDARWKFDGTARVDYSVRTEVFWLTPAGYWAKGTVNSETGTEWFSVTTLP